MYATHAEMAHELRGTLAAGEPCPVCRQEVHRVPKAGAAPKVTAAEKALAKAEKAETKARTEQDRCAGAEASARTAVGDASAGIGRAEVTLAPARDAVAAAERLAHRHQGSARRMARRGRRPAIAVRGARGRAHRRRTGGRGRARRAVERARAGLDEATRLAEGAGGAIATFANRLSGVWGRLERGSRRPPRSRTRSRSAFAVDPRGTWSRVTSVRRANATSRSRGVTTRPRARGDPPGRGPRGPTTTSGARWPRPAWRTARRPNGCRSSRSGSRRRASWSGRIVERDASRASRSASPTTSSRRGSSASS